MSTFYFHFMFTLVFVADAFVNLSVIRRLPFLKKNQSLKRLLIELFGSLLGMVLLYFVGIGAIYVLKTSEATIKFSAGFVILLSGLKAVFNKTDIENWELSFAEDEKAKDPSLFVPCALPLITGPAWFSAALFLTTSNYSTSENLKTIFWAWTFIAGAVFIILGPLKQIFQNKVLKGIQAVIGLIVTIIGVQILLEGLSLTLAGIR